jgi:hypothetical protein
MITCFTRISGVIEQGQKVRRNANVSEIDGGGAHRRFQLVEYWRVA